MPFFASPVDSTLLFFRDYVPSGVSFKPEQSWASQLTLVFLHGWPMSSRMWEHLLLPLCESYRFRCIAPDKRGFGRSDWNQAATPTNLTWKTFTSDLIALLEHIDVQQFVFIGTSMGCNESLRAYQTSSRVRERCKGFVWLSPVMPYPLQTPDHPLSPPTDLWDSIIEGLRKSRSQFVADSLPGVFAMQAGNEVTPKVLEHYERIVADADSVAIEKTVSIFNESSEKELRNLSDTGSEIPIMILHGDADQGMPLEASAALIKDITPWADLKIYKNGGHGIYLTHAENVLIDILGFVQDLTPGH
ncbi:uncharacterized protein JN550_002376 [Neoarthrinium moseri]|uniref:uncharacterized protein n=1 Tax=Neoarthrinium moseri TaxID=1658444 RepID=UPI001FDB47B8|nr:uncharacterized protein JN550_002376 [Neoarthrinium moseri]KAI1874947.1 hypothetical protein JN550_002376 [Neoarthrinium moseri]